MQATLRRLYSSIPDAAAVARTRSTPRAVRLRRLQKNPNLKSDQSDATPEGLTPTEFARYQRQLAKGDLMNEDGSEATESEWLERLNSRRTRVRGVRKVSVSGGAVEPSVVAQKIYLPNIIFKLVRNFTPPGEPYNPYEATFRIAQSVTKTDIRSYLHSVYGVQTTYIRTDNYLAPTRRDGSTDPVRTYKRAVVGLVEPFYYPQAVEDMAEAERKKREEYLETTFEVQSTDQTRKLIMLRISRAGSSGWRWRTGATAQRGNILRIIAERRAAREDLIDDVKGEMVAARGRGERVLESPV
ncbi:hypothetical protein PHLCEN_2v10314 [Hermanssonia centrifuga]|uniref:Large ribosomal subunit protein uL23m n=1 Tax=Hermanssonia centrifuga TaxID=98765 RepID=A0A2R6NN85_9APHY|nr:hypothetical protein PHLCEN_2v10314 [Hermanssonia centrifuga]